ncbi:hypothetical protein [Kordiimonas sp. SCSIO 12610]|uniref:hypothetical protein n=1 Tax=Kordiimonas sp. SCSIO 12610 TaxID=2829597 RepID=UPI00210D138A|nr:hypothetical protein [Kordiimonas sp. SCSIO 12610]UTW55065.1 hypothetical protein KFF44_14850 [Kordiimonas sp. SCSIO 12610]
MNNILFFVTISATLLLPQSSANAYAECPKHEEVEKPRPELFVFVGKKVSIEYFNPNESLEQPKQDGSEECQVEYIVLDAGFKAKYKVIKPVFGNVSSKYINFKFYTHWGEVQLPKGKNTLLFIHHWPNKNVSAKYLYHDVQKTYDGNWGICGDPYFIPPEKINSKRPDHYAFRKPPSKLKFIKKTHKIPKWVENEYINEMYPTQYFKVKGRKAKCQGYGYLVEELFEIEKKGAWQLAWLFTDPNEANSNAQ